MHSQMPASHASHYTIPKPQTKAYYEQQRAEGAAHQAVLRALAFKWLRILWRCWQHRNPYDEAKYLDRLEKRKSPIAARAHQMAA